MTNSRFVLFYDVFGFNTSKNPKLMKYKSKKLHIHKMRKKKDEQTSSLILDDRFRWKKSWREIVKKLSVSEEKVRGKDYEFIFYLLFKWTCL